MHPEVPSPLATLRARFMFVLAFAHLLLVAGLIHRATSKSVTQFELDVMYVGLVALWPVFVAEAAWGVARRDRARPRGPVVWRAVLVMLLPSWRMALPDPRTGLIWVPRLGWRAPGMELFKRLDLAFVGPMLAFAFLILPILLFEYFRTEQVKELPAVALALDLGVAVIWVAFATEFVFKASSHPKPFAFAQERWIDVVIVALPMLEFVVTRWVDAAPLARLLRAGRAISPESIARMQRLYRLQGLARKAWHALMLLEWLSRLLGSTPEKRLAKLESQIAELEGQLHDLRADADEVRTQIAEQSEDRAAEPEPTLDRPAAVP